MPDSKAVLEQQISDLSERNRQLLRRLEGCRANQYQNDKLLGFERLLSELSAKLINLSPSEAQSQIEQGLELMAGFLDVDQVVIIDYSSGHGVKLLYGYRRDGAPFTFPEAPSKSFPWANEQIKSGNILVYPDLPNDIPAEAENEILYMMKHGFNAALVIPLMAGDTAFGCVICYSFEGKRKWRPEIVQRLRLFGEMMSNTINRHRAEIKLHEAFSKIQDLNKRLQTENLYLREEINLKHLHPEIVGKSRAIVRVLNLVEQVADTDATVLIMGETGTGKELVAHAIHKLSLRQKRAMVTLNCAALPPTLVESELFGHEKGAFTGASRQKPGRFEAAHGSTIFLDEIDSLSLEIQAKLLRVLQQGAFERLGGIVTMKVDVRVIAASNKDLKNEVSEGSFREDLFYRLNVFPITVPPLRKRPDDIPLLVREFVNELSRQMGKRIDTIPTRSMETLKAQYWPGNIRELKNIIERAVIITKGGTLKLPNLEPPAHDKKTALTLDDVQRNHILDILEKTGWRVSGESGAARLLGVKATTLEYRMKKLGINRPNKIP